MNYQVIKGIIEKINDLKDELDKLYIMQEQESDEEFTLKTAIKDKEDEISNLQKQIKDLENEIEDIIQNKPMDPEKYEFICGDEKKKKQAYGKKVQNIIVASTITALISIIVSIIISLPTPFILGFLIGVSGFGIIKFNATYKVFKDQMFKVYDLETSRYENKAAYNSFMQNRPDLSKKQEIIDIASEIESLEEAKAKLDTALEFLQLELQDRDKKIYEVENNIRGQESCLMSLFENADMSEVLFNEKLSSEEHFVIANLLSRAKNRNNVLTYKNPNSDD